ncbi:tail fiber protein [Yersinia enterocolitica]|uniref:phage tail-collar fiber domain-containing protein n=1 Tax=Yersinia enterocolitica TaxID=630 RepID=UPI0005E42D1B|nr:phage tail protein [Yersinia enterocolitica]ELW7363031.1 phage tail protein [Yersinia enterocolitica]CNE91353.1 tail fiber protein [Yersinia enterocolitica]
MATVITRAFEHWQAQQVLNNQPARPDTLIFAHVPGLDPTADINPDEGIPADGQIVHRDAVAQYGMINDSAVAYSVVLDTRIGDFTFNWIGLVDTASNTLCMIVHTPAQQKIATANGVQGNNITRTFLMEFAGAAEASQITVSAQTWQIDFSARLRGIDEVNRLANLDYYGHAAFFGDGFSVGKDGDKYRVKAGLAYIGGIRALLADDVLLEAAAGNVVYADVSYQGSVLSEFAPIIHLGVKNSAGDFGDYADANGFTHYIASLALITASGEDDKREANPFDKAIEDINAALAAHEKSRNHPDATLNAKGFTQLGNDIDSDSEKIAATLKAVKKVVNAGVTVMSDHVRDENPHDQYLQITEFLAQLANIPSREDVRALIDAVFPIGVPMPYPLANLPATTQGIVFFKMNGGSFNVTSYPKLAAKYPTGVLPDLRGEFIRGFDDGRGVRADQNLLGWQGHGIQSHNHGITNFEVRGVTGGPTSAWFTSGNGVATSNSGGDETRPRNIAFNYIVRAA